MTSWPDAASSEAVGSSARTSAGPLTSARAIATRWRWPPESCAGRWWSRSPSPSRSRIADGTPVHLPDRGRLQGGGHADVLDGRERAEQVVLLEDEADVAAVPDQPRLVEPRQVAAEDVELPCWTRRSAPIRVSSVVFPEPEGPVRMTISPRSISSRDVEQGLGAGLALAEPVVQALGGDDRRRGRRGPRGRRPSAVVVGGRRAARPSSRLDAQPNRSAGSTVVSRRAARTPESDAHQRPSAPAPPPGRPDRGHVQARDPLEPRKEDEAHGQARGVAEQGQVDALPDHVTRSASGRCSPSP